MSLVIIPFLLIAADLPSVRYVSKVVTRSWEPIELSSVEAAVTSAATGPLTSAGAMKLEKSGFAELKTGDYSLLLEGRFIEQAEVFSVYLTFGPGKRSDLPSFVVSESGAIGKLERGVMLQRIEGLSRAAATRLATLVLPRLESIRLVASLPPVDEPELPFAWGPIESPVVQNPSASMRALLDPRNPDHERANALPQFASQAFDQPAAQKTLLVCVLRDPSPDLRARCVDALAPVARADVPTQRILLHALRNEVDPEPVRALMKLAAGFVGLSRKESIETWLELVSSESAPAESASAIAEALAEEGDVPNLDLAVARCLTLESLVYGKRQACAQWLLPVIPAPRRMSVVARYLENVRVFETGESNAFGDVSQHVAGRVDASTAELFLRVAERPSAGHVRDDALFVAMKHPSPTPAILGRVVALVADPKLTSAATRALVDLVDTQVDHAKLVRLALEQLLERRRFMRQKYGGDPREEIARTIDRMARIEAKKR